jgi:hypothetical protein
MTMFSIYYERNVQQNLYELKWIYGSSLGKRATLGCNYCLISINIMIT